MGQPAAAFDEASTRTYGFSSIASVLQTPSLRQITQLVQGVGGINLGQGTCQLPAPREVVDSAADAMEEGHNGYTSPRGLQSLRMAVAKKLARHNKISNVDIETELTITSGATGALEGICAALLDEGDEVILFEPFYPYHQRVLQRSKASIKYVALKAPTWTIDEEALEAAFSEKTKFVIVNTPSNPCGKVFSTDELLQIGRLCIEYGAFLVTDEIYEYMLFDGNEHVSAASLDEIRSHVLMIGGFSKTFAITGWRIGFLLAPAAVTEKIVQILDLMYICPPAPLQEGVSRALDILPNSFYENLSTKYKAKRDFFAESLRSRGLRVSAPAGSYYLIADYSTRFPEMGGMTFVKHMISKSRVGAVPAIDFIRNHESERWVRFCVAVSDEVLQRAADKLKML